MATPDFGRILLIDDDRKLQFVLSANLRAEGYEVVTASNGREGLAEARRLSPDIIIMDVSMPVMNGVEATRELKADPATSGIPIIMLTARSRVEDLVVGLECGAEEYLTKPFEMAELMARIRSVRRLTLARRELSAANERLTREVSEKTRRLGVLYRFARQLNEVESQQEILDRTVEAVQEATGAKRISIMLPDPDGKHLRCVKSVGMDPGIAGELRVKTDAGIAGNVYSTGKTIVANVYPEADWTGARYSSEAFVSAPLVSATLRTQDAVIGVLNVTEKPGGVPFDSEDADCIRSIADVAAVALHNQIRRQRLDEFVQALLLTVGRLAEYRDEETSSHLERVQRYAGLLARRLQRNPKHRDTITNEFIRDLIRCTPLHDIGKVGIPDEILLKSGSLTPEEFETMKGHVEIGRKTLEFAASKTGPMPLLSMCIDIVHAHHEKYDGTGYPLGRRGEEIPLAARIVALADAYDAITSHRPYKDPLSHEHAVRTIRANAGRHFDPDVVEAFLAVADEFDRIRAASLAETNAPEPAAVSG
ncbi:MAG: HD domain-containing phosphohydrolase [Phycisphaerae bacterium]